MDQATRQLISKMAATLQTKGISKAGAEDLLAGKRPASASDRLRFRQLVADNIDNVDKVSLAKQSRGITGRATLGDYAISGVEMEIPAILIVILLGVLGSLTGITEIAIVFGILVGMSWMFFDFSLQLQRRGLKESIWKELSKLF